MEGLQLNLTNALCSYFLTECSMALKVSGRTVMKTKQKMVEIYNDNFDIIIMLEQSYMYIKRER